MPEMFHRLRHHRIALRVIAHVVTLADVKALLRMAVVWNIPIACDRATADFMISSPLMDAPYERIVPDYSEYRSRAIPAADAPPPSVPPAR